jgi:hypothetical protein
LIEDETAVPDDVKGGFPFDGLDGPDKFVLNNIVLSLLDIHVDLPMVDNDDISLPRHRVIGLNILFFSINNANELQSDIVLEADCEISQKKDAFLDDAYIGFQNEIFLDSGIDIIKKIHFLIFL